MSVVRPPLAEDFEQIHQLGRWMQENSNFSECGWAESKIRNLFVKSRNPHSNVFVRVAEKDREIIGFMVGCVMDYFFSEKKIAQELVLVFHPNHRKNVSRPIIKMIVEFERWAEGKGAVHVAIGISSGIAGSGYEKLLSRLGYKQTGLLTKKEV